MLAAFFGLLQRMAVDVHGGLVIRSMTKVMRFSSTDSTPSSKST